MPCAGEFVLRRARSCSFPDRLHKACELRSDGGVPGGEKDETCDTAGSVATKQKLRPAAEHRVERHSGRVRTSVRRRIDGAAKRTIGKHAWGEQHVPCGPNALSYQPQGPAIAHNLTGNDRPTFVRKRLQNAQPLASTTCSHVGIVQHVWRDDVGGGQDDLLAGLVLPPMGVTLAEFRCPFAFAMQDRN